MLALGIFTFCVVAIVGLLGVGLGATRSVANECSAVNIAESIYGAWQVQEDPRKTLTVTNFFTNLPPLGQSGTSKLYFDGNGVQVQAPADAALELDYAVTTSGGSAAQPLVSTLQLAFKWPRGATTNNAQTRSYARTFVKGP